MEAVAAERNQKRAPIGREGRAVKTQVKAASAASVDNRTLKQEGARDREETPTNRAVRERFRGVHVRAPAKRAEEAKGKSRTLTDTLREEGPVEPNRGRAKGQKAVWEGQ